MEIEQMSAKVKSSVWQAIAQSGVSLSAITPEDQSKLVESISSAVLVSLNDVLDDIAKPPAAAGEALEGEEVVIWEGRPFLSLVENYTITSERIKVVKGLLGKETENFELIRVQDIDVTQKMGERMIGVGDVTIVGADPSDPRLVLRNIKDPQAVYELLRKAWLAARKKYGFQFREMM